MGKNVMIPSILLDRMIELLECWDISEYGHDPRFDYANVLWAPKLKKQNGIHKPSYSSLVEEALSQLAREDARQYFLNHRLFSNDAFFDGEPF